MDWTGLDWNGGMTSSSLRKLIICQYYHTETLRIHGGQISIG